MALLTVTKNYQDGDVLLEADLDAMKSSIETFVNVTRLNDDNLQDDGITGSDKLVDASVSQAKLASNSVATAKIVDSAVTTAKILDSNVTTAKIADSNVTTAKIADSNITTAKIADANVTAVKLATGSVTEDKLGSGAVTETKIGSNAVTTAKIADGNVTTAKLASGAVTSAVVGAANATMGHDDVGQYGFFYYFGVSTLTAGSTTSGANLLWASVASYTAGAPSGTWKCLGYCPQFNITLFVRVS